MTRRLAATLAFATLLLVLPARADTLGVEPSRRLTAARAALEDGLYDVAIRQMVDCVREAPAGSELQAEATLLLAQARYGEGRYAQVIEGLASGGVCDRYVGTADRAVFWRALARYELGLPDAALSDLENFEGRFPASSYRSAVLRLRASCLLRFGRSAEALEAYAAFEKQFADSPDAPANRLEWARALIDAGRPGDARPLLETLVSRTPDSAEGQEGRRLLAGLLVREGQWQRAWNLLDVLANNPTVRPDRRASAWYGLAALNEAQTNLEAAVAAAEKGCELAPTPAQKRRGQALCGRLYLRMNRLDEGVAALKTAVAEAPDDPQAAAWQMEVAGAYMDRKRYEKAADEYQAYVETFTNRLGQARALSGKGWALFELRRYAEAAPLFEKAAGLFERSEDRATSLIKAGDAYFGNEQFKQAAAGYLRVVDEFHASGLVPRGLYQAAESMIRGGDAAQGRERLRELPVRFPGTEFAAKAILRLAELDEEGGRLSEALDGYRQVADLWPTGEYHAAAIHRRGLVLYALFRLDEALASFREVVDQFPASEEAEQAYYMRGWCLYRMGKDEEALSICRAFLDRYPASVWAPGVRFWLGEYAYNHGDYSGAEREFLTLAGKGPDREYAADALFWAGRAAARSKEYVRSVEHFAELARAYPQSPRLADARFFQGDALSELGEFAGAILAFEEVITRYPTNRLVSLAWGRKGDCQFTLGAKDSSRYTSAMESYREVLKGADLTDDQVLQAEYKIGRCMEKLGRVDDAFEQYYTRVVCRYLEDGGRQPPSAAAAVWFTRAAFGAADIMEAQKSWRRAVRILQRVVEAAVPAAREAQERIERIRGEHWMLF